MSSTLSPFIQSLMFQTGGVLGKRCLCCGWIRTSAVWWCVSPVLTSLHLVRGRMTLSFPTPSPFSYLHWSYLASWPCKHSKLSSLWLFVQPFMTHRLLHKGGLTIAFKILKLNNRDHQGEVPVWPSRLTPKALSAGSGHMSLLIQHLGHRVKESIEIG